MLRLAGTLAYLAWAFSLGRPTGANGVEGITGSLEPTTIDETSVRAAIKLMADYFWPHARACLCQIGLTDRHRNARRALRWIRANGRTEVSREDIRRAALSQALDAEQTNALLDSLVKAGWLFEATTKTRGRDRHRWNVNPQLFSGCLAGSAESAESPL